MIGFCTDCEKWSQVRWCPVTREYTWEGQNSCPRCGALCKPEEVMNNGTD